MCGICCILSSSPTCTCMYTAGINDKLLSNLQRRGPDLSSALHNQTLHHSPCTAHSRISPHCTAVKTQTNVSGEKICSASDSELEKPLLHSRPVKTESETCSAIIRRISLEHDEFIETPDHSVQPLSDTCNFLSEEVDFSSTAGVNLKDCDRCVSLFGTFVGQVLHLRGDPTPQPAADEDGNILLWNGEIFDGIDVCDANDTNILLRHLKSCRTERQVIAVLEKIRGPWSFTYWQKSCARLWFGRDFFGRRSLLWQVTQTSDVTTFALSSVACKSDPAVNVDQQWREVAANGLYSMDLATWPPSEDSPMDIDWYPWQQAPTNNRATSVQCGDSEKDDGDMTQDFGCYFRCGKQTLQLVSPVTALNMSLPDSGTNPTNPTTDDKADARLVINAGHDIQAQAHRLIEVLGDAVRRRVTNVPCRSRSKGNLISTERTKQKRTSVKKANLASNAASFVPHDTWNSQLIVSPEHSHSSSTVCLSHRHDNSCVIDNYAGDKQCHPSATGKPEASCSAGSGVCSKDTYKETGMSSPASAGGGQPDCSPHVSTQGEASTVGILFSGGLDSIVLAALADRFVLQGEAIDLFNVAFEQKVNKSTGGKGQKKPKPAAELSLRSSFDVPDRITGKAGLVELRTLNPARKWNFVEIDVTLEELQVMRAERLRDLLFPQQTVLDDSIGCAIWFAARGRGRLATESHSHREAQPAAYCSPAKVVLVGMGADEQLAGYSRHRSKFSAEGWQGLLAEIKMEVARISARNLGRDDRVISDHGRESRYPYLDEDVVSFLNSLPIWEKADLTLPRGIGEKLLLRVAAQKLGLGASAKLPKRAIQFGSRIAKMEDNRERASDVCSRLSNQTPD